MMPGKNSQLLRCHTARSDRLEVAVMKNSLCERLVFRPDLFNQLMGYRHGSDSRIRPRPKVRRSIFIAKRAKAARIVRANRRDRRQVVTQEGTADSALELVQQRLRTRRGELIASAPISSSAVRKSWLAVAASHPLVKPQILAGQCASSLVSTDAAVVRMGERLTRSAEAIGKERESEATGHH